MKCPLEEGHIIGEMAAQKVASEQRQSQKSFKPKSEKMLSA